MLGRRAKLSIELECMLSLAYSGSVSKDTRGCMRLFLLREIPCHLLNSAWFITDWLWAVFSLGGCSFSLGCKCWTLLIQDGRSLETRNETIQVPLRKIPVGHWLAENYAQGQWQQKAFISELFLPYSLCQCDFWRLSCCPAPSNSVQPGCTFSLACPWFPFSRRTWSHTLQYLVTVSEEWQFATLPGTEDTIVTRQNMAPVLSGLVKWHEIWGRWTRALLSDPVFTIQMISPSPQLCKPQFPQVSEVGNDTSLIWFKWVKGSNQIDAKPLC